MKKFLKIFIPILYLGIGVGGYLSFELYFKDKINTIDVVVAKADIKFKETLSEENLQILSIRRDNAVNGVIEPKDIDTILNRNASITIKKGTQIYSDLIDEYNLIPNEEEGEFIAPIPDEWLFAVPGSLRRTFVADFYAIPDKEQSVIQSLIKEAQEHEAAHSHESQDTTKDENGGNETTTGESDENKTNNDENHSNEIEVLESLVSKGIEPILEGVRVASVKDGANREVTESQDNNNSATGSVSTLEIISNQDMLTTLKEYTANGYKIYVVYKYGR